jgi:WD40 repeat protein
VSGIVQVWRIETHKLLRQHQTHESTILAMAFSPDGLQIAAAAEDIQVWDVWDAKSSSAESWTHALTGHTDDVCCLSFSPDGRQIVSGSADHTAIIWNVEEGGMLAQLEGHTGTVKAVAFSGDGTRVVTGSNDRTLRVWRAHALTGECLCWMVGHTAPIYWVWFSPDDTQIISVAGSNVHCVWDAASGEEIWGPWEGASEAAEGLTWAPTLGGWVNIQNWMAERRKLENMRGTLNQMRFSKDGHMVAVVYSGSYKLSRDGRSRKVAGHEPLIRIYSIG